MSYDMSPEIYAWSSVCGMAIVKVVKTEDVQKIDAHWLWLEASSMPL